MSEFIVSEIGSFFVVSIIDNDFVKFVIIFDEFNLKLFVLNRKQINIETLKYCIISEGDLEKDLYL